MGNSYTLDAKQRKRRKQLEERKEYYTKTPKEGTAAWVAWYEKREDRARHDDHWRFEFKYFFREQSKWYQSSEILNYFFGEDCIWDEKFDYEYFLIILDFMVEDGFLVEKKEGRTTYYACKQKVMEEAPYELKAAKENLSQCKKKFSSISKLEKQLEEMKAENLVKIKAAAEAVEAAKAAYESCVEQKDKVQKELEGMGFFAFGEKKKAKAEIASLDNRAASLRTALTCAQSDKENLEQSVEADEKSAQENIDKIRTDYSAARERVAAAKVKAAEVEKRYKALQK